jgi:hypothetical protein
MAFGATVVWEVRGTTGNDNNGGGFDATGATDYSQQTSPQVIIDGSTITGTIQATTTQYKLTGYTVAAGDAGNIVNINGGTMTQGRYRIASVITGASNTWVLDRSGGTNGQTGTGRMGGCLATIQKLLDVLGDTNATDGEIAYIKADATYNITTALSFATNDRICWIRGYTTTRGDNGRVTIAVGTGAGINAINGSKANLGWMNFIFDGTATSGSQGLIGINITAAGSWNLYNCRIHHFANEAFKTTANDCRLMYSEFDHCGGTNGSVDADVTFHGSYLYVHDNTGTSGIRIGGGAQLWHSAIMNNTGIGVRMNWYNTVVNGCLVYGNSSDGIQIGDVGMVARTFPCWNNLMAKNGGYGLRCVSASTYAGLFPVQVQFDYNGYWSNTSGARLNFNVFGPHDVEISGTDPTNDPFTDKASGDFTLNNTAGAGALLRATGFPGVLPGLSTSTGDRDIGPFEVAGAVSASLRRDSGWMGTRAGSRQATGRTDY